MHFPVAMPHNLCHASVVSPQEITLEPKLELLQGTLDLMVLQTLATLGSLHGYGVARRIEQVSGNEIASEWGVSDNNRKAKYYSITKGGRKQLAKDAAYWQRLSDVMTRMLAMSAEVEG
jgi:PadR family transcriptional regulator PadR